MVAKMKFLYCATLITCLTCVLLLLATNIGISFFKWRNKLHSRIPSGSWEGDLCARLTGDVSQGGKSGDKRVHGGSLRDVMDEDVWERSIFFHETSCSSDLNPRQACAVESAARANREKHVYVLMTSPNVSVGRYGGSRYARLLSLSYPNVDMLRVHLGTYSRGTPMEDWVRGDILATSKWVVPHAYDAMRFLTLWKHGGTSLDLDVVTMRPLTSLGNYAVAEGEDVASSIISLDSPDGEGHPLADAFVREFVADFRGYEPWHNGPGVMTRVLGRLCNASSGESVTWTGCPGKFKVQPQSAYSPIRWVEWEEYFNESTSEDTMQRVEGAMAVHLWDKLSSGRAVRVDSRQPYALLAAMYCPVVYSSCGDSF